MIVTVTSWARLTSVSSGCLAEASRGHLTSYLGSRHHCGSASRPFNALLAACHLELEFAMHTIYNFQNLVTLLPPTLWLDGLSIPSDEARSAARRAVAYKNRRPLGCIPFLKDCPQVTPAVCRAVNLSSNDVRPIRWAQARAIVASLRNAGPVGTSPAFWVAMATYMYIHSVNTTLWQSLRLNRRSYCAPTSKDQPAKV